MARILLVDDDPLAVRLGRAILEREGHAVLGICNWSEVGPALFSGPVDLVLLDVNLPGLQGDRLTGVLKQTKTGQRTPVVLISNLPEADLRDKQASSGADGWIQKPLTTAKARDLIRTHCTPGSKSSAEAPQRQAPIRPAD